MKSNKIGRIMAIIVAFILVISVGPAIQSGRADGSLTENGECECGCYHERCGDTEVKTWHEHDFSDPVIEPDPEPDAQNVTIQVHEDKSQWSVKGSDNIIGLEEDWGQIVLERQGLYADPLHDDPGWVGWIRPTVQLEQPTSITPGEEDRDWKIIVSYQVWGSDDLDELPQFDYKLGGMWPRMVTTMDNEIRQYGEDSAYDGELGGVNLYEAEEEGYGDEVKEAAEAFASALKPDKVGLVMDLTRSYAEAVRPESGEHYPEDHIVERIDVEYERDEVIKHENMRLMHFWETIDWRLEADQDGNPKESSLRIDVDGRSDYYQSHIRRHNEDITPSWRIKTETVDELQDCAKHSLDLDTDIDSDYHENVGQIEVDEEPCDHCDKYEDDTEVTLEANPDSYFEFSHWVGDYPIGSKYDPDITVEMDENKELTAWFTISNSYELTTNTEGGGYVDPSGTNEFYHGEEVDVSADGGYYYSFTHWEGDYPDGDKYTSDITVEMDEDKSLTAHFEYDDPPTCPWCGGPFGHCYCGGPMSLESESTLEQSEFEAYLEEGQIAPELLEALVEEGMDDLDREAELSPSEEGWLIQQDSEQRYWIELAEKELRVYDIENI